MQNENEIRLEKKGDVTIMDIKGDITAFSDPFLNDAYQQANDRGTRKIILKSTLAERPKSRSLHTHHRFPNRATNAVVDSRAKSQSCPAWRSSQSRTHGLLRWRSRKQVTY